MQSVPRTTGQTLAEGPDAVPLACSFLLHLHAEVVVQSHLEHMVNNCLYITALLSSDLFKKKAIVLKLGNSFCWHFSCHAASSFTSSRIRGVRMHKSISSNDVHTRLLLTHSCVIHEQDYVCTPNSATYLVLQSLMLLSSV